MNPLAQAVSLLEARQDKPGLCLGYTRWALYEAGRLKLPRRLYPFNTALANHKVLAKDPGRWGLKSVPWRRGQPLPDYCIVYFDRCGRLRDGRIAGHIGIYHQGIIYSSTDYEMTDWWMARIVGVYIPT